MKLVNYIIRGILIIFGAGMIAGMQEEGFDPTYEAVRLNERMARLARKNGINLSKKAENITQDVMTVSVGFGTFALLGAMATVITKVKLPNS